MRTRSLALLFLPLLMSGCTVTVTGGGGGHGWEPVGTDYAIYGAFDVARPGVTLAEACADAGISWVELVVLDSSGTVVVANGDDGLWAYCEDGEIDSLAAVVTPGTYQAYWVAYDEFDVELEVTEPDYMSSIYAGYYDAYTHFFGDVYMDITLNYEDFDVEALYTTCLASDADKVPFAWTLYDLHPDDPAAEAIYDDGGATACVDYIIIDDEAYDYLYAGYTYYLELFSTNASGAWWETVCAIDVYYGDVVTDCDVPIYFPL